MLLLFIITNIVVAVAADPFHKYPYVFLLDVGNEELESTNTEQIRVTVPGGALALKYPAEDTEDTIAHVRVSGVDFGTDLKASIVEGGPGYNYVILLFMGNPGVPYDAVVTLETVNQQKVDSNGSIDESIDSAEDTGEVNNVEPANVIEPSSSNVYKYTNGDTKSNYEVNEGDGNDEGDENVEDNDNNDDEQENEYSNIDENRSYDTEDKKYEKYQAFRPQLYGGARIYPQASLYVEDNNYKPIYDPENHADEANNYNKNIDSNNNNINTDYSMSADY